MLLTPVVAGHAATGAVPAVSFDGQTLSLSAENGSFAQILEMFKRQTGLEYDIPPDLKSEQLPLVDIHGLSIRAALLKILEGCNYDYILMAEPANPDRIVKVLVTGKSTKIASSAVAAASGAFPKRVVDRLWRILLGAEGKNNKLMNRFPMRQRE